MVRDYAPLLEQALLEERRAGLQAESNELEMALSAPFTTSSDGRAIRRFLQRTRGRLPGPTKSKFNACLNETYLAYPGWRKLVALIKRPRSLEPD